MREFAVIRVSVQASSRNRSFHERILSSRIRANKRASRYGNNYAYRWFKATGEVNDGLKKVRRYVNTAAIKGWWYSYTVPLSRTRIHLRARFIESFVESCFRIVSHPCFNEDLYDLRTRTGGIATRENGTYASFYNCGLFFFSCDRWIFYEAIEQRFWEAKCSSVSKFASLYVAFERAAQLASCRPRVNDPGPHTKCKYLHEQLSVKGNIRFFR